MLTVLKIAAITGLVLILLVVGGAVLVLRWFRKVLKEAAHTPTSPPCRVYPEPEPHPQWRTPDRILQLGEVSEPVRAWILLAPVRDEAAKEVEA